MPSRYWFFLWGVIAASAVWFPIVGLWEAQVNVNHASNVEAPMTAIVEDLDAIAKAGNCGSLKRKVALLRSRWAAYRSGGGPPVEFFQEIQQTK